MQKTFTPVLFALLLAASPALAQNTAVPTPTTLEISAQVDVKGAPDIATVSAGLTTVANTAGAALSENATQMNAVFAALKKAGVAEKDMQTSGLTIYPQYAQGNNEAPRIGAYQATNMVNVTMRDLKNIGPTLDALVSKGVNQVNGPSFGIEDPEELLDKARAEAVKKARKRAEIYASAAGLHIARVLSISEQTGYVQPGPMPMMKAMAVESQSTPVATGEVSLNVTVNVKYELAP